METSDGRIGICRNIGAYSSDFFDWLETKRFRLLSLCQEGRRGKTVGFRLEFRTEKHEKTVLFRTLLKGGACCSRHRVGGGNLAKSCVLRPFVRAGADRS